MDNFLTLPPQVNGEIVGFLYLFVNKIRFLKNIYFLAESEILVQVQWWGEISPVYIRPKVPHVSRYTATTNEFPQACSNFSKYAIKTNLKLFESYLDSCEVLEFTILNAVENLVIGSAFLRNLIKIINMRNQNLKMPFINYSGEIIGYIGINISCVIHKEMNKRRERTSEKCGNRSTDSSSITPFSVSTSSGIVRKKSYLTTCNLAISKKNMSKQVGSLNFDLSNSIERNYYEKFFLQPILFRDSDSRVSDNCKCNSDLESQNKCYMEEFHTS